MNNLFQIGKELGSHGQTVIFFIVLCSIVSLVIILERLMFFHKASINLKKFMKKITPILERDRILEAVSLCDKYPSILTRAIKAGMLKHDRGRDEIREAIKERVKLELLSLERYLPILSSMAYIAPLVGFLGTVLGMIEIFSSLQNASGLLAPGDLARGMGEALLSTAAGLVVAIPNIIAHNYFLSSIDGMKADAEQASHEIISSMQKRWQGE